MKLDVCLTFCLFSATIAQFMEVCPKRLCISTVGKRTDLFSRSLNSVLITDFFGSNRNIEIFDPVIHVSSEATSIKKSNKFSNISDAESVSSNNVIFKYPKLLPILDS
jgi:glycosylphosphatidylinositol transamidase (GPIT) subunit GPI8